MSARPLTHLTVVAALAAAVAAAPAAADRPHEETSSAATRVRVTLHDSAVTLRPRRVAPGRVTFVVRNAGTGTAAFLLARSGGGLPPLPRFEGIPFVPADLVVARVNGIRAGASRALTRSLARGEYLLVESTTGTFVRAATSLRVG
jgi:hypothetical protein